MGEILHPGFKISEDQKLILLLVSTNLAAVICQSISSKQSPGHQQSERAETETLFSGQDEIESKIENNRMKLKVNALELIIFMSIVPSTK